MKKADKLQLLSSNNDARDLYYINEEFSRVKFLLRSISSRKGVQTEDVEKIISSFRKVRIGSVINEYIKIQQLMSEVVIPPTEENVFVQFIRRGNKYITEVVSLADRLLSACLCIVSTLASNKVGDKKREYSVERALNVLDAIIDKTSRDELRVNLTGFRDKLTEYRNAAEPEPEEATETTVEAESVSDNTTTQQTEENAVAVICEAVGSVSDDIPEHVDILAGIVSATERETEMKKAV